jgi:hypothetical protein
MNLFFLKKRAEDLPFIKLGKEDYKQNKLKTTKEKRKYRAQQRTDTTDGQPPSSVRQQSSASSGKPKTPNN